MNQNNFLIGDNIYTKLFISIINHAPYIAPYLFYLKKRTRIKYNFGGIIGEQGSGKSYWAIIEALINDPTFNIERIIFSSINFLDALDMLEDRTLKGRSIIWDDAGVGLPASEWYALSNRIIKLVGQTVRTLHPDIKFTMPDMGYLDPTQRKVLTHIVDCERKIENRTDLKIYTMKRMRVMGENIYRRFSFSIGGMIKIKLGNVRVFHAPMDEMPEIFRVYEKLQTKFKFETRKKLRSMLEGLQIKNLTTEAIDDYSTITLSSLEKKLVHETYERVFRNSQSYLNKSRRIDEDKVMLEFRVSRKIALLIKRYYDKKILPDQVKEDLGI